MLSWLLVRKKEELFENTSQRHGEMRKGTGKVRKGMGKLSHQYHTKGEHVKVPNSQKEEQG